VNICLCLFTYLFILNILCEYSSKTIGVEYSHYSIYSTRHSPNVNRLIVKVKLVNAASVHVTPVTVESWTKEFAVNFVSTALQYSYVLILKR